MNKQELIERIENLPCFEGPIACTVTVNREWLLQSIEQLEEMRKVKIPEFVADWIKYCKKHNFTLFGCLDPVDDFGTLLDEEFEGDTRKCVGWCRKESDKIAHAWLDGYEIEQEKRYLVEMKGVAGYGRYLNEALSSGEYFFASKNEVNGYKTKHTRKELENSGFGWVFDCPGVEVKEVK